MGNITTSLGVSDNLNNNLLKGDEMSCKIACKIEKRSTILYYEFRKFPKDCISHLN